MLFRSFPSQDRFTEETYRTDSGIKVALPTYYKQKNMDRSRTRSPPNHKRGKANKVLQQNSYQSRNNRTIQRICRRSKILAINQKNMTEREKKEVCKGYADLIIKKEQLIREIWKTEFGIRNLEDVLKRNKILIPTPPEEPSEADQAT